MRSHAQKTLSTDNGRDCNDSAHVEQSRRQHVSHENSIQARPAWTNTFLRATARTNSVEGVEAAVEFALAVDLDTSPAKHDRSGLNSLE